MAGAVHVAVVVESGVVVAAVAVAAALLQMIQRRAGCFSLPDTDLFLQADFPNFNRSSLVGRNFSSFKMFWTSSVRFLS